MPFVLGFFGLVLVFLEFFVPGGILAVLGSLCLVGSLIWTALSFSMLTVLVYFVIALVAFVFTVRFALYKVKQKHISLESDFEGSTANVFDASLINEAGVVLSDLKPSGFIKVNNQRVQAVSECGFIKKGKKITVTNGKSSYLIVKPL